MRNRGKYMRNFPLRFFEKKADIFTLLRPYTSTQNAKISQENLREILNGKPRFQFFQNLNKFIGDPSKKRLFWGGLFF
jgi:hypothetical protein